MANYSQRRDSKHRILRRGESVRANGKYQFKYHVAGKPRFIYSWRLEPTDPQPKGKKPDLSLREKEKLIGYDIDLQLDPLGKNITVMELVERYLATRTGVKASTLNNYNFIKNILKREDFAGKKISQIKVSDAKLFLIKMQKEDGKGYSTVKSVRGVLRPAFQMAVDDDRIPKNPFAFELVGVVVNDSVTREAIKPDEMRKFLKFIHDDNVYYKYYDTVFILFHTGMRISEFCGLTVNDIDLEGRTVNIDHQLLRNSDMSYHIQTPKTAAGKRKIPITDEVAESFARILEDRGTPRLDEKAVDGYRGFLYIDDDMMPLVAMHWEHRFNHMVNRYNDIYKIQIPNITPHICRHTYCSNMARSGMNPKTLQYLMGHSDIGVTMNTYTHLGFDDARDEMIRMEELEQARKAVQGNKKENPVSQKLFRII